jgi:glutamate synthase domain-containing protein 3
MDPVTAGRVSFNVGAQGVTPLNRLLHRAERPASLEAVEVLDPKGLHSVAVGARWPVSIDVRGHVGYYCAGMNQAATVRIRGNAGKGVAENIVSGVVRVEGNASDAAAASGRGGLVVVHGSAAARCGISMKGVDIVVGGSVGHAAGFMAQAGTLVVCGDAGPALGDSIFEAVLYVRGRIAGLGADAQLEPMSASDRARVEALLDRAGINAEVTDFKRVGSARRLYHWHAGDDRIHG